MPDKNQQIKTIHLRDYYLVILKHRYIILACFLAVFAAALAALKLMTPVYEASCRLSIGSSRQVSPISGQLIDVEDYFTQNLNFMTHFQLVTSRPVMERVLEELAFSEMKPAWLADQNPVLGLKARVKRNLKHLLGMDVRELEPEEKLNNRIELLRSKIGVQQVSRTTLMQISVMDPNSLLAREIANILARVYIQFDIGGKLQDTRNSFNFLKTQSQEQKRKLERAEKAFLLFKQQQKLFSFEGKQEFISQKIAEFNNLVVENRYQLQEVSARLAALDAIAKGEEDDGQLSKLLVGNQIIGQLNEQLIEAQLELSRLRKVYRDKHPKVVQVLGRIEDTKGEINRQIDKELSKMRSQQSLMIAKEEALQQSIDDLENEALDISTRELEYKVLQRNYDSYREQYEAIMAKLKQADIITDIKGEGTIRLVEEAVAPLSPSKPDKRKFLLGGLFGGLFLGFGLAFLLDFLDQSLRNEEDVNRHLGLPVLAVVPLADADGATYGYGRRRRSGKSAGEEKA